MGRPPGAYKDVNQEFFRDESGLTWYVRGACYHCIPDSLSQDEFFFRHASFDLVSIVKRAIGSEHEIVKFPNKSSYQIRIQGVPRLYESLVGMGFDLPKNERWPPKDMGYQYAVHFVRGFIEGRRHKQMKYLGNSRNELHISYNIDMLKRLDQLLRKYAKVVHRHPNRNNITYYQDDLIKIHHLCYITDWEYTRRAGIYFPFSERLAPIREKPKKEPKKPNPERIAKVEAALQRMDEEKIGDIAEELDYSGVGLRYAIEAVTGFKVPHLREMTVEERLALLPMV